MVDGDLLCVVKAPLRADLTGGYTDVEPFLTTRRSRSISVAVSEYVTVSGVLLKGRLPEVLVHDPRGLVVHVGPMSASRMARRSDLAGLIGRLLQMVDIRARLSISFDVPLGCGAGTSGAGLVATTRCLLSLAGIDDVPDMSLPHLAATVERLGGHRGGLQDQFAAVVGGFTAYAFQTTHVEVVRLSHAEHVLEGAILAVPPPSEQRMGSSRLVEIVNHKENDRAKLGEIADLGDLLFAALIDPSPDSHVVAEIVEAILYKQHGLHPLIKEGIEETPIWDFVQKGLVIAKPLGGAGRGSAWIVLPSIPETVRGGLAKASWSLRALKTSPTGISSAEYGSPRG